MAVAFDSVSSYSSGGYPQNLITRSHTLGYGSSNNRIVLALINTIGTTNGTPTFSTITYNGTTMNLLAQVASTVFSTYWVTNVYYLLDTSLPSTSGSYNLQYQTTTGYDSKAAIISYTGVAQSTPPFTSSHVDNLSSATGAGVAYSTNITISSSSGMIVDCVNGLATATATGVPGTSQTERVDAGDNDELFFVSDKTFSASGSNSMSWTPDLNYWCIGHTLLELAASGGGTTTPKHTIFFGMNF